MKKLCFILGIASLCSFNSISQIDCDPPYDVTISDASASDYSANFFSNKKILLQGTFTVDQNTNFDHCIFFMDNSKIDVLPNVRLGIESCELGCGYWDGIYGGENSYFWVENSYFEKFENCFYLNASNGYLFYNNSFISDGSGIAITGNSIIGQQNQSIPQLGVLLISENQFDACDIGIDLMNCRYGIFIGDNNKFEDCRFGIRSENSIVNVNKPTFISCEFGINLLSKSVLNCKADPNVTTFEECEKGVWVNNSNADISYCKFDGTPQGIGSCCGSDLKISNNQYNYEPFTPLTPSFVSSTGSNIIAFENHY